ncbi:MAG: nucleoside-triphosphatase [Bacteroidales bacterium]|nr:nucleoside-triphosphatase [Bacteroidales bacterium]
MVFIISGERKDGKSYLTHQIADELIHRNLDIGGILCPRRSRDNDDYDLLCIDTGEKAFFSSRKYRESWIHMGPFYFNQETILMGRQCLDNCLENPRELVVIDEIGPLERRGLLWDEHLRTFLKEGFNLLLSIRSRFIDPFKQHYGVENILDFKVKDSQTPVDIGNEILREIKNRDE